MRLRTIGDLIAHARAKAKATTVGKLGLELADEAEKNVPLLTPVIGKIVRGVLDHANPNGPESPRAPPRDPGIAVVLGSLYGGPIGSPERDVSQKHAKYVV